MREVAFGLLAAVLLPVLAAAVPLQPADAPSACTQEALRVYTCTWDFEFGAANGAPVLALPPLNTSEIDLRVTSDATVPEYAWAFVPGNATDPLYTGTETAQVRTSPLPSTRNETQQHIHHVALLVLDPADPVQLRFTEGNAQVAGLSPLPGALHVVLRIRETAGSALAPSHAGTWDDPQVKDPVEDSNGPDFTDIAGAWMDDPVLDDALMQVGVWAPNLTHANPSPGSDAWFAFRWKVLAGEWGVAWVLHAADPLAAAQQEQSGWTAKLWHGAPGQTGAEAIMDLPVQVDAKNGTLAATVPLHTLGDPKDSDLFTGMEALSYYGASNDATQVPLDKAGDMARAFAVGGPAVWGKLRGVEDQPLAPAWYAAPLAPDNIPNTIQVGAFLGAGATAVYSAAAVRKRRQQLRTKVDLVDDAADGAPDPSSALRALDALQVKFDGELHAGQLSEAHYDILARRIERAAFRLWRRDQSLRPARRKA
ncbi:MAG: hypothetical protein LC624_03935 [Halobacteriales archaeon]|nr:hypothetical protein [Halobacteriales archaeon]